MKTSAQCQACAFYYSKGKFHYCVALTKLQHPGSDGCDFFKTEEELRNSRQAAYERLEKKGYFHLIDQYGLKPETGR